MIVQNTDIHLELLYVQFYYLFSFHTFKYTLGKTNVVEMPIGFTLGMQYALQWNTAQ